MKTVNLTTSLNQYSLEMELPRSVAFARCGSRSRSQLHRMVSRLPEYGRTASLSGPLGCCLAQGITAVRTDCLCESHGSLKESALVAKLKVDACMVPRKRFSMYWFLHRSRRLSVIDHRTYGFSKLPGDI